MGKFVVFLLCCVPSFVRYGFADKFSCPPNSPYFHPCTCESSGDSGIYVKCENSNLASMSIGLANIYVPIKELHLYKCNFRRLYGDIFRSLIVEEIVIEDTPISVIEDEVFVDVSKHLKKLRIKNAHLQAVPSEALKPLTDLEVLEIVGGNVTTLERSTFPPLPRLKELRLNYFGIQEMDEGALKEMKNLERIDFHHNQLTTIPRSAFRNKRAARILDLSYNNFTALEQEYFKDLSQLTWCNMSHNQISEFDRNSFSRNAVLGWLSLSHNMISRIESNAFRSMRSLRRLYLNDNKISRIDRGAFKRMRRIGTIDLARNNLAQVDLQMFEELDFCEIINLEENDIGVIKKNAFKDLQLVAINISYNRIKEVEEEAFVNVINMTVFDLRSNNLSSLPKKAFPGESTYMTEFFLQYNNIRNLSEVPFHFSGIKVLNITHSGVEVIPRNTFPKLYELHTIDASYNNIREIGNGAFINLFSLRFVNLSHNALEVLKGSIFGAIPTLLELDLSHNQIQEVSSSLFSNLISLRRLILNNNHITTVFRIPQALNYLYLQHNNISFIKPHHTWPEMNALLYLYLDHNNLHDSLTIGSFANLNSLNTLSLKNNSISKAFRNALQNMHTLQYLNLESNNITILNRGAFGRLPTLFELNLSNNGLYNISKQSFEGFLQLLTLNLSYNNLETIPNDAFRGLVSLRIIDLSHNRLSKVDNGTNGLFEDLLSVEKLNLSHNEFFSMSKKMFPYHKYVPYNIKEVDMSYNTMPVVHKNLIIGLQKVQKLNFSHNILNEIRPNVFGNLSKLEIVDLSFNELEAVGVAAFASNSSIREIYLQNNKIISVPAEVLMANANLTMLDLRNNEMQIYYDDFVPRAIKRTRIRYNGNPLICNCVLRKIRNWLSQFLKPSWDDIECPYPEPLSGRLFTEISEAELRCPDRRDLINPEYQETSDVRFRFYGEPSKTLERLKVDWAVSTRDDVGGFRINVNNATSSALVTSLDLGYRYRHYKFKGVHSGAYEVCVIALDSNRNQRTTLPGQCDTFQVSGVSLQGINLWILLLYLLILLIIS